MREAILLINEGQKIFAMLHTPVGIKKGLAVVLCHGFGGNKIGTNRLFVLQASALARAGIAALRFDCRGCGESEGDFHETTFEGEVSDLLVALDFMKDYEKMGLIGVSLGSLVALRGALLVDRVKSIALWAPIASSLQWQAELKDLTTQESDKHFVEYGGKLVNKEFFEQFFAVPIESLVESLLHLPLLHIHGAKDPVVPFFHRNMYEKWRERANAESKFLVLPNSDHGFSDVHEQEILLSTTLNWFKESLYE